MSVDPREGAQQGRLADRRGSGRAGPVPDRAKSADPSLTVGARIEKLREAEPLLIESANALLGMVSRSRRRGIPARREPSQAVGGVCRHPRHHPPRAADFSPRGLKSAARWGDPTRLFRPCTPRTPSDRAPRLLQTRIDAAGNSRSDRKPPLSRPDHSNYASSRSLGLAPGRGE